MEFWDRRRLLISCPSADKLICTYPYRKDVFPILCTFKYKKDEGSSVGTLTINPITPKVPRGYKVCGILSEGSWSIERPELKFNEDAQVFIADFKVFNLSLGEYVTMYSPAIEIYADSFEDYRKKAIDWTPIHYGSGSYHTFYEVLEHPLSTTLIDYQNTKYNHSIANYSDIILSKCQDDTMRVNIMSGVDGIGGWVDENYDVVCAIFKDIKNIESISFPNTVKFLDVEMTFYAISKYKHIQSLELSSDGRKINYELGTYAFNECESLVIDKNNEYFSDGNTSKFVLSKDNKTVYYGLPKETNIGFSLPNTVEQIEPYAFAFRNCGDIDLTPLGSLSKINTYAFLCCASDKDYTLKLGFGFQDSIDAMQNHSIEERAFWGCNIGKLYLYGNVSYKWGGEPNQITRKTLTECHIDKIGGARFGANYVFYESFANCENLERTYIGRNVIDVLDGAYRNCKKLSSLGLGDINDGVEITAPYTTELFNECAIRLCSDAYKGCSGVSGTVQIPHRVFSIDTGALDGTSITHLILGNGLKCFGYGHFVNGTFNPIGSVFGDNCLIDTLEINSNIKANIIHSYRKYEDIEYGVDYGGDYRWNGEHGLIDSLKTLKFNTLVGSNVTDIDSKAFRDFNLNYIYLGREGGSKYTQLRYIGSDAFEMSTNVEVFDTGNSDYTIGGYELGFSASSQNTTVDKMYLRACINVPYNTNIGVSQINNLYIYRGQYSNSGNISKYIRLSKKVYVGGDCHEIPRGVFSNDTIYGTAVDVVYEHPETIYSIGSYAYASSYVNSSVINSFVNVRRIDDFAFEHCNNLNGNISISNCEIGNNAFIHCENIQSVTLTNCYIGNNAFLGCTNLTEISLVNCKYIGDNAFDGCINLDISNLNLNCDYIGSYAFRQCGYNINGGSGDLTVNCNNIGIGAFYASKCLNRLYLVGVEHLCNSTFQGCSFLKYVNCGSNLRVIGDEAFHYCSQLTTVTFSPTLYEIGTNAFSSTNLNLNGLNFNGCTLKNVRGAFSSTPLVSDESNYYEINGIKFLVVNNVLIATIVSDYSASFETSVHFGTISSTVRFTESLYNNTTANYWSRGSNVVYNKRGTSATVNYIPGTCVGAYVEFPLSSAISANNVPQGLSNEMYINTGTITRTTDAYSGNGTLIYIGSETKSVTLNAPYIKSGRYENPITYAKNIESVTLPSVTWLPDHMFSFCYELKELNFDTSKLNSIGAGCFSNCESLEFIDLSGINGFLPSGVLYGTGIKSVKLGAITGIGDDAFSFCTELESIEFTDDSKLEYIGDNAFNGCEKLSFTVPSSVKYIGKYAFCGCKSVSFGNNVCVMNEGSFAVNSGTIRIDKNYQKVINFSAFLDENLDISNNLTISVKSRQTLRDIGTPICFGGYYNEDQFIYDNGSEEITDG